MRSEDRLTAAEVSFMGCTAFLHYLAIREMKKG
jgi:hypothetical protein